ncbi:hypothetical protein GRF59_01265 [Paenibacillus sp. HJL G12]|uniref:Uncharacterized protein n=1 Tax=Paenibacillus dendrobii TaxID=2691084 RepID=A0A7X3LE74_9BACL|nr:hypothetical protein [Paenibacillus dendrobii]MWV42246.1 hypothetical protein [Paenibacillus dendrobii]
MFETDFAPFIIGAVQYEYHVILFLQTGVIIRGQAKSIRRKNLLVKTDDGEIEVDLSAIAQVFVLPQS